MAVGISFGTPTGGAGFDVTSTVTAILAVEAGVETPWKTHLAALQTQDTQFTAIGTQLSALSTALGTLTDADGLFAAKQGSSSDTNVLSLSSASTSAVAGSHTIVVTSLAQTSSQYSDTIATASDTLSGSITVGIGSSSKTVTVGTGSNTLASLAATINQGSYGVTASVISDTNGSRLSLVSNTSGSAGQITLTSNLTDTSTAANVGFTQGQAGADASLTVDGLATTSASNTVTAAIPGVTFQLLSAAPAESIQVQITNDNSSIESAFTSLVTAYNAITASIKTQEGNDPTTGAAEPLFGNPTLSLLQTQLSQALQGGSNSGAIKNIQQLGLSVQPDGTLALDTDTLDAKLNSNFSDVETFFQATGSFGQSLTTTLNNLGNSTTTGAISLALAANATQETGINTDISTKETQLATEKTSLTAELNTANEELQAIPSQLNEINELYAAFTGYNPTTS